MAIYEHSFEFRSGNATTLIKHRCQNVNAGWALRDYLTSKRDMPTVVSDFFSVHYDGKTLVIENGVRPKPVVVLPASRYRKQSSKCR